MIDINPIVNPDEDINVLPVGDMEINVDVVLHRINNKISFVVCH